jgi:hypothetical protein
MAGGILRKNSVHIVNGSFIEVVLINTKRNFTTSLLIWGGMFRVILYSIKKLIGSTIKNKILAATPSYKTKSLLRFYKQNRLLVD